MRAVRRTKRHSHLSRRNEFIVAGPRGSLLRQVRAERPLTSMRAPGPPVDDGVAETKVSPYCLGVGPLTSIVVATVGTKCEPWVGAPMSRRFDAIVIGAGQAGPPMAGRLARAGKTVALVERKLLGGTCVNVGCTPTKTLVASAYAAHLARRAADYGVSAGPVGVDFAAVMARMKRVVGEKRGWPRILAREHGQLQGVRGPRPLRFGPCDRGRGRNARGRLGLHQRRRPGRDPGFSGRR